MSIKEVGINPACSLSLPGYTWQCGLKTTSIKLRTLQDKDDILILENNIRGGVGSLITDRYVKRYCIVMLMRNLETQCLKHYRVMEVIFLAELAYLLENAIK